MDFYLKHSYMLAYLAAYLGGVLVSFTPCVYPMIPITVAYISGQEKISKARGFALTLSYVLGVSITYTGLGIIAALTGSLFGSIQTHPLTYLVVACICVLLGLAMLEVFMLPTLKLPIEPKKWGALGGLFLGIASGLIMSPCTAPVLGVLLSYVATTQNIVLGAGLLFTFAFGMGTLIILIGTFTAVMASMPKPGQWMVYIQRFSGAVLILIGIYFLISAIRMI